MRRHYLEPNVGDILMWKDPQGPSTVIVVLSLSNSTFYFATSSSFTVYCDGYGSNPFDSTFYYPIEVMDRIDE